MRIFYINLDRRKDRRDYMEAQFSALGLQAERFVATTPADVTTADLAPVTAEDAGNRLTPTEIATSVSHQRVWRRMIAEGATRALVLEDDCELSPELPAFLRDFDRYAGIVGLVRLETRSQRQVLARRERFTVSGIRLHRPCTWAWGSAAYVVSQEAARRFLGSPHRFCRPFDEMFLSPTSPIRVPGGLLQAVPALAFVPEGDATAGSQPASVRRSDLEVDRLARAEDAKRTEKVRKLAREARRIRRQIAGIGPTLRNRICGRTMIVPFARDPEAEAAAPEAASVARGHRAA